MFLHKITQNKTYHFEYSKKQLLLQDKEIVSTKNIFKNKQ